MNLWYTYQKKKEKKIQQHHIWFNNKIVKPPTILIRDATHNNRTPNNNTPMSKPNSQCPKFKVRVMSLSSRLELIPISTSNLFFLSFFCFYILFPFDSVLLYFSPHLTKNGLRGTRQGTNNSSEAIEPGERDLNKTSEYLFVGILFIFLPILYHIRMGYQHFSWFLCVLIFD